jgi:DtxR family Mn-dependent transcriptional regulator
MIEKTKEDYLRAIYHLSEEYHTSNVSSVDICKYIHVSKSTVSEMMKKLANDKLIETESYGKIKLTKKGLLYAIKITRNHRIIEVFLLEVLKIKRNNIHDEAHRLEHAFSDDSILSLSKLIKNKDKCPHGKKIPSLEM